MIDVALENSTRPRFLSKNVYTVYAVTIILLGIIYYIWLPAQASISIYILSILVTAVGLYPSFRWIQRYQFELPIFEAVSLSFIAQYVIPVYFLPYQLIIYSAPIALSNKNIESALYQVLIGLVAFISGYSLRWKIVDETGNRFLNNILPVLNRTQSFYILAFFIKLVIEIGYKANLFVGLGSGYDSIVGLLRNQLNVALILAMYDYQSTSNNKNKAWIKKYLWISASLSVILGVLTGLLEQVFTPLVSLLVVYCSVRKQVPWKELFIGVFIFAVLNAAKYQYRDRVWFSAEGGNTQQNLQIWQESILDVFSSDLEKIDSQQTNVFISVIYRLDQIRKFAYFLDLTPSQIPFWNGRSYEYFFVAWIPRLLWPDKPSPSTYTNLAELTYRLKTEGSSTSIGLGFMAEAYINFGNTIFVMFLFGIMMQFFNQLFGSSKSWPYRAIYLTQSVQLLNGIGSYAVILLGALLQNIIANVIMFTLLNKVNVSKKTLLGSDDV
jgi:hypothetical protein